MGSSLNASVCTEVLVYVEGMLRGRRVLLLCQKVNVVVGVTAARFSCHQSSILVIQTHRPTMFPETNELGHYILWPRHNWVANRPNYIASRVVVGLASFSGSRSQPASQPDPLCHCPAIILTQCGAVSLMACLQAQNIEIAINQLTFITIALEGNYNTKRVLLPAAPTTKYNAIALSCSSIIIIFTRITYTFVGGPVVVILSAPSSPTDYVIIIICQWRDESRNNLGNTQVTTPA